MSVRDMKTRPWSHMSVRSYAAAKVEAFEIHLQEK